MVPLEIHRVLYVAVATRSGEVLDEPSSYATAAIVARFEQAVRMEAIADEESASREDCAAAVADTECGVRFHSSAPYPKPDALAALEGTFRYASGWEGWYDPSAGRYLNRSDVYEPVGFDPSRIERPASVATLGAR